MLCVNAVNVERDVLLAPRNSKKRKWNDSLLEVSKSLFCNDEEPMNKEHFTDTDYTQLGKNYIYFSLIDCNYCKSLLYKFYKNYLFNLFAEHSHVSGVNTFDEDFFSDDEVTGCNSYDPFDETELDEETDSREKAG